MTKIKPLLSVLLILGLCNACALRRANQETDAPEQEQAAPAPEAEVSQAAAPAEKTEGKFTELSPEQKMESMNSALSRTQARLEELDAKISALTDKLDATRVTVDNLAGTPAVSTQLVGAAAPKAEIHNEEHAANAEAEHKLSDDTRGLSQFRSATGLLKAGKYSDAVLAFNNFANSNPDHILAGSAHYHAGEAYMLMGETKLALAEYSKVVANFPASPRVPSALVRMAHCYKGLGNSTEATRTLSMVQDQYPGNPSLDLIAPHARHEPAASPALSPMEPK